MNKRQASLAFIFVTATLDMIGLGIVIPSLPHIMGRFFTSETDISSYYGYFIALFACMQFFASPLLGSLSDRFGRRPILLNSLLIGGLDYLLMAFAPTLPILFAGRVLNGLCAASMTVAMAYIADISNDGNRAKNFGIVGAAFGLGFIIGPALGGLLGQYGPPYPFLLAAALNLANFLFGLLVLPESFPPEKRRKMKWKKLNPLSSLRKIFQLPGVLTLAAAYFCFVFAGQTHPSIWVIYTESRFGWTTAQIGMSLALVGILSAIAQGWLTGILVPKFGEFRAVLVGTFCYALSYFFFGLANQGWMMYAILIGSAVFWVANPALQSMITKKVPANEVGELQGSLMSLASLAAIINPLVVTQLFAHFRGTIPGAPYFLAAAVCLVASPLIWQQRPA